MVCLINHQIFVRELVLLQQNQIFPNIILYQRMFGSNNQIRGPVFPTAPPGLFGNPIRNTDESDLVKRLEKVQQECKKLQLQQEELRKQLEECKKNPTQDQYDQLKRQLEALRLKTDTNENSNNDKFSSLIGLSQNQQREEENQGEIKKEQGKILDSISILKKICQKKETELEYAVAVIEKQQKTIEAQSLKICGLELQIENGFAKISLQLANLSSQKPSSSFLNNQLGQNSSSFPEPVQLKLPSPYSQMPSPLFSERQGGSMFNRKQTNPLSQSAVYEVKPYTFQESNSKNVMYKEDGYLIKCRTVGEMIHNLEISNFVGKIEVLEPISKNYLANRRISQIVNIGNNVCEIIDHSWDNLHIKLTTFNFMNMQQMSLSERVELNKKVKQQAEITGLDYSLDAMSGNLEIISKPKPPVFKF